MNRMLLLVLAVNCSCAATTVAGDYLLRLDTVGYADTPKSDKAPEEKILSRMETIVRPGTVFHSKVRIGMQTRVLQGEFHPTEDGKFAMKIRYAHTTNTGNTVPTESGGVESVVDECSVSTTVTVSLGTPVLLGGMQTEKTETTQAGEKSTTSKIQHVVNLYKTEG